MLIAEVFEPDERLPRDLVALRRFAQLMDAAFRFPGTQRRFGIDALLGLIPGVGDIVGALMSTWIIAGALRHRVPARTVVRMVMNISVDLLFGSIPLAGDVFDFLFEENVINMRLLEKHRDRKRPPRSTASIALIVVGIGLLLVTLSLALVVAVAAVLLQALRSVV